MKKSISTLILATASLGCQAQTTDNFKYTDEQFADIQMLRYKVEGFEPVSYTH